MGIASFGGGTAAKDYGSLENLMVRLIVLVVIVILKHGTKGFTSFQHFVGYYCCYIVVAIMGMILPTTAVDSEGVEFTKAWVLNWDKVAQAGWFSVPRPMPVKLVFDARAIVPICIMFIVTAVETVGDISGITEGGVAEKPPTKNYPAVLSVMVSDPLLPRYSAYCQTHPFSQNVGLVAMNKVVNRFTIGVGGIFLILCGLFPKLSALINYAAECPWRSSGYDVCIHCRQWYPAYNKVAGNSKKC